MDKHELSARLQARLAELEAALRSAEDQAQAIRGGIAELELLLSQAAELPDAAGSSPAEETACRL